jgi:S1-C subfamily serine protease
MNLDNAIELQQKIFRNVFEYIEAAEYQETNAPHAGPFFTSSFLNEAAQREASVQTPAQSLAVGIEVSPHPSNESGSNREYGIIVYSQERKLINSALVERINRVSRGEARAVYVGRVRKLSSWEQSPQRPLRIGSSVGHRLVTAGSLGCFVSFDTGQTGILSNNHVLANLNQANLGDSILQPGRIDGGQDPSHRIGTLHKFIPISFAANARNFVDAAVAALLPGIKTDREIYDTAATIGTCASIIATPDIDESVIKVGRSTGFTRGRIQALNVNNLMVAMSSSGSQSIARFDGQLAIEGSKTAAFSKPGDSGALVLNSAFQAVGLIFAGTKTGGSNGLGLTYANPIDTVLRFLDCEIAR